MKRRYMCIKLPTLVVPRQEQGRPFWGAQRLAPDTVVAVLEKTRRSPVTGRRDEPYVQWVDVAGRVSKGWLPKTAVLVQAKEQKLRYVTATKEDRLTSWDTLRCLVFANPKWNMCSWVEKFGRTNVPLLHAVIRELGVAVPKSGDPGVAITLTLKCISKRIHTMAKKNAGNDEAAVVSTKKSAKKGSAKKGGKKGTSSKKQKGKGGAPGRVSMFAGKRIVKLVKDNPRREDTHGYNSWELLTKGMTYDEYIAAGGRRVDLAWDIAKGNVKLAKA